MKKDRPTWERRKPPVRTVEVTPEGAAFATTETPAEPATGSPQPATGSQAPAANTPLGPGLRRLADGRVVGRVMVDVPPEEHGILMRYLVAHRSERATTTTVLGPAVLRRIRSLDKPATGNG